MVDAMDLSKADIIVLFGDFMNDCAEMLGVKNDSDQICLAIETLKVERDDMIQRVESARNAALEEAARIAEGTIGLTDVRSRIAARIRVLVSHETPIGERQTDDGMGGAHGG